MKKINLKCGFGRLKGLQWGRGNTKKILALHGWLDNAASFHQLAPLLSKNGYEVVAIDFTGHGKSDHRAKGHYTHFVDYVLDVQEALKALNWDKPILLGHSMGAAMAHLYTIANPSKVEKLIMIENLGAVPSYEKGTVAKNLSKALAGWKVHSLKHKYHYNTKQEALDARQKATPMADAVLKPLVDRNLKNTKKGYRWRTDRRLKLASLFRLSEEIVLDALSSEKPPTQLIIAEPRSYALQYEGVLKRQQALNPQQVVKLKGHHHLHMDNAQKVFQSINTFLKQKN